MTTDVTPVEHGGLGMTKANRSSPMSGRHSTATRPPCMVRRNRASESRMNINASGGMANKMFGPDGPTITELGIDNNCQASPRTRKNVGG